MYYGQNFPNADTSTAQRYPFDFTPQIQPLDTIASVDWAMEVAPNLAYQGLDPDPSSHLSNEQVADNVVMATLSGMLANVRYKVAATVTTSNGLIVDYFTYIQCDPAPISS